MSRARALVLGDDEIVARQRRAVEAEYLDRGRRAGLDLILPVVIDERTHPAPFAAGDKDVANAQRAALDEYSRDGAAAAFELRLEDDAFGRAVWVRLQIEQFGLQQNCLFEPVEIGLLQRRDFDVENLAAELFDNDFMLQQLLPYPLGPRILLVHLVDGDDDRRLRRLGMADRLDRLLHDAVIGGHYQHHDIGHIGAPRAHRGKRLMTWRIDKGDLPAALQADSIGADMLGDAAGFAGRDIGLAQRVEQRGLAVVDMAHDGDDRRARHEQIIRVLLATKADLDIRLGDTAQAVAELGDDEFGGIGVDDLVDRRHDANAHQRLDHVDAALRHAVRQLLNGDRLGDDDFAHDLDLLLLALMQPLALALPRPAHRSQAAHALAFIAGERAGDGDLSGSPAHFVARGRDRLSDLRPGAAARRARGLFFLFGRQADLASRGECGDFGRSRFARPLGDLAPQFLLLAPLRFILGALARIFVGTAAILFLLDLCACFIFGAPAIFLGGTFFLLAPAVRLGECGATARFFVGLMSILHRAHAAGSLFVGQCARRLRPDGAPAPLLRGAASSAAHRQPPGPSRSARLRACRADHALLAHFDGDSLRAAVRETLAYLAGFHALAQLQPAARCEPRSGAVFALVQSCRSFRSNTVILSSASARKLFAARPPHLRESRQSSPHRR